MDAAPSLFALLLLLCLILAVALLWALRGRRDLLAEARWAEQRATQERLETALRDELRGARREQAETQSRAHAQLSEAGAALAGEQHRRLEAFATRLQQLDEGLQRGQLALREGLAEEARKARGEQAETQRQLAARLAESLQALQAASEQRLAEVRATLDARLQALQADNAAKLEQMRATVDEKLQSTLEMRLGQSFALVSERLEAVQRGLGEMQALAAGVGDLKRVLGNVKTRGTFGEVQLGALLEQMLVPEQYASNVATSPGSNERVEFAIRLPGPTGDAPVWLPIDAKFAREDYERLIDAQERADGDAAAQAGAALERRIRQQAETIRDKYVSPPHTTDFAILFLPTEGLYAEVLRRPGLFDKLQREQHITVAGPTTLAALLNSLQMGFRTLAIQQRSSEVWQLLGAVKTEFAKFGAVLDSVKKKLDQASTEIEKTGVRSRAIARKLREVEALEPGASHALLQLQAAADSTDDAANNATDEGNSPPA